MDLFDDLSDTSESEWDSELDGEFEIDPNYVSDDDEEDPDGPDLVPPPDDSDSELEILVPVPPTSLQVPASFSTISLPIRPGDTVLHRSSSVSSQTSQTSKNSQT